MQNTKLVCLGLYEKIDNLFYQNGYSHRLKVDENNGRFVIWFSDENNYHVIEFGRMTYEKAEIFLTAYLHGFEIGLI